MHKPQPWIAVEVCFIKTHTSLYGSPMYPDNNKVRHMSVMASQINCNSTFVQQLVYDEFLRKYHYWPCLRRMGRWQRTSNAERIFMPCHHDAYDSVHHKDINATKFPCSTVNFNYSMIFHWRHCSLSQIRVTFSRLSRFLLALRHWCLTISTFCRRPFHMIFFKNANKYTIVYQKLILSRGLFCVYCGHKVNNSDDCYTILHQSPHNFHHKRLHLNFHHQRNYKPAICLELLPWIPHGFQLSIYGVFSP